jgi:hypothetical protein
MIILGHCTYTEYLLRLMLIWYEKFKPFKVHCFTGGGGGGGMMMPMGSGGMGEYDFEN